MSKTRSKKAAKEEASKAHSDEPVRVLEGEVVPGEAIDSTNPEAGGGDEPVEGEALPEVIELGEEAASEIDDSDTEHREDSSSNSLVPYNALDAYLAEIRRLPPLTREEEHAAAVEYSKTKSAESARKLVFGSLWLVVKIARDYEKVARNVLDLIQEGNIGLMEAVQNFDPYRGVRFPSYAVWWIRAYIIRYIIANWRLVKIGTTQAQRKLFFNLKKESDRP